MSSNSYIELFYVTTRKPNDEYYKTIKANGTDTVCGFDDFYYDHGCLAQDKEP